MDLLSVVKSLESPLLYGIAVALIFTGLYIPVRCRNTLLLPVWGLLVLSMRSIDRLDWLPGLSYEFGMLAILTFLCSPLIFHTQEEPLKIEVRADGTINWNLKMAYKIFNNPRRLPTDLRKISQGSRATVGTLVKFTLYRLLKIVVLVALKIGLNFAMMPIFVKATLSDFSPAREPIIRRLVYDTVTSHELIIRAFISTIWIFDSISQLEISHAAMGILFVAVLRVDEPHEWPPLFGNPLEAYSLKRFWGRFWHRLFTSAGVWARALTDNKIFSQVPVGLKKAFAAFFIFTVSGLAHAIVGWKTGDTALERDIMFFWCNFLGVCFEMVASKYLPTARKLYLRRMGFSAGAGRLIEPDYRYISDLYLAPCIGYDNDIASFKRRCHRVGYNNMYRTW
ncbi:membrane bound O-acyl transferase family-domain-containing protein [Hypomontagnella monticulosa]|nr:membrane bound O-acyl transferase family-domain-containing protein [Hypomontagnella monticulosa]